MCGYISHKNLGELSGWSELQNDNFFILLTSLMQTHKDSMQLLSLI